MESPPTISTNSETPLLSEDSGLVITNSSFSSDSVNGWHHIASELQESDFDERSLSLCESTETSERMCGDYFNTVKKGPVKVQVATLDPPPEFQDNTFTEIDKYTAVFVPTIGYEIESLYSTKSSSSDVPSVSMSRKLKSDIVYERRNGLNHRFASPRLLHFSPCRANRPSSRNSLSSRLSSSHNSLVTQYQADDSSFITQAISHDTLSTKTSDIIDMYNVPLDSDIYAVPIDMIQPSQSNIRKVKRPPRYNKKRRSTTQNTVGNTLGDRALKKDVKYKEAKTKRRSLAPSSRRSASESDTDSLHFTLREMRKYLHTIYSSSSDSECRNTINKNNTIMTKVNIVHSRRLNENNDAPLKDSNNMKSEEMNNNHKKSKKNAFVMNPKNKKHKDIVSVDVVDLEKSDKVAMKMSQNNQKHKMSSIRILSSNLKQSFCNLFRWRRHSRVDNCTEVERVDVDNSPPVAVRRALPPLPQSPETSRLSENQDDAIMDFATSIQRVKDYGWYWGPISVEAAERILSNEPDGSFIVRDSNDDHYIFTLTFKLNGMRHVRIEHDQGSFCFGGCMMFKARTIVEFIEKAVETSRSGRYLFFLNLRPVLGPVRVQLLYPVSRFKRVQSLQHMCRFVILKYVRRDLINSLPLPRRLVDYLNATHYYSELLADI